jgi:hypothetical protein
MADRDVRQQQQGFAASMANAPMQQEENVESDHAPGSARLGSLGELRQLAGEWDNAGPSASDRAFGGAEGRYRQAIGPGGAQATQAGQATQSCETSQSADERDQKRVMIEQVQKFVSLTFRGIDKGCALAMDAIDVPELPKTDVMKTLLGVAASTLLAGSSGAVMSWIVGSIATAGVAGAAAGAVKSLVGGAVTKALQADHARAAASLTDVKLAFHENLVVQVQAAEQDFTAHWPEVYAGLSLLPTEVLTRLNQVRTEEEPGELIAKIRHQTLIAWANFLARAKHGAMGPWDHWETNGSPGAIALPGAEPKPAANGPDPTRNNIQLSNFSPMLDVIQRPMADDPYGVLEIFVMGTDAQSMHVVDLDGYRMRMDNVGPKVREDFKTAGKVRDLPVNKIVHLCSYHHNGVEVDPPTSIASVLITADGYVRAKNGLYNNIAEFANAAQGLPLSWLEV